MTYFGVVQAQNVGEGGKGREVELGPSERVEKSDDWRIFEDDEPAIGGANAKLRI